REGGRRGPGVTPPDRGDFGDERRGGPGGPGGESRAPDAISFERDAALPSPPPRPPAASFRLHVHAELVDSNASPESELDAETGEDLR
ncbi:MAG: hypothetical protein AAGK04_09345, partial [Planctomycetota bacterium]